MSNRVCGIWLGICEGAIIISKLLTRLDSRLLCSSFTVNCVTLFSRNVW